MLKWQLSYVTGHMKDNLFKSVISLISCSKGSLHFRILKLVNNILTMNHGKTLKLVIIPLGLLLLLKTYYAIRILRSYSLLI